MLVMMFEGEDGTRTGTFHAVAVERDDCSPVFRTDWAVKNIVRPRGIPASVGSKVYDVSGMEETKVRSDPVDRPGSVDQ